jgi:demethylmenaquinone methyltransferase/2-methoxy-6-polyprenyl-1,4-benzoquinol methylase
MFTRIAPIYDRLNRVLSLGLDRGWRRAAARTIDDRPGVVLDLCAGTGDLARLLVRADRVVIACDGSEAMLRTGRQRGDARTASLVALTADAYRLPLASDSVDALTIGFGLRNLHRTEDAVEEMARVLRPGGRLTVLEFAPPPRRGVRARMHRFFVGAVVPRLARLFTRDPSAYRYLAASVLGYLDEATLAATLRRAGLAFVRAERLGFGAVQVLVADKCE